MRKVSLRTLLHSLGGTLLVWVAAVVGVGSLRAQEANPGPRLIQFSGALKDTAGQPLSGVQGVTFALYKDQQGGPALWLETQNVTADEQGRYSVLLGATASEGLPLELFSSGEARWLGVQAIQSRDREGAVLMEQPRVLLVSVPYALKAADAETLGGLPASAFVLSSAAKAAVSSTSLLSDKAGLPVAAFSTGIPTAAAPSGSGTTNNIVKWLDGSGTLGDAMNIVEVGGNFGIGTTSPTKTLDVAGTVRIATPGTDILQFINTGTGKQWTHYLAGDDMRYYEYGPNLDRLTIQGTTGNVGIGTNTPATRLDVAGTIRIATPGTDILRFVNLITGKQWTHYLAGDDMRYYEYGPNVDRLTIQGTTGYIGIGTTNPLERLDVAGTVKANTIMFGDSTTQTSAGISQTTADGRYAQLGATNNYTGGQSVIVSGVTAVSGETTGGLYGGRFQNNSAGGTGVYGLANAATGGTYGVFGVSLSTAGTGVYGTASATSGTTYGVYGQTASNGGTGVFGDGGQYGGKFQTAVAGGTGVSGTASATSGTTYGVYGQTASNGGTGVYAYSGANTGVTYGVFSQSNSSNGTGVYGFATATNGTTYGVVGQSASPSGTGVFGEGGQYGGKFQTAVDGGTGVYGKATPTSGLSWGVYGESSSAAGAGVKGFATATGGPNYGVFGQSISTSGTGVRGYASATSGTTYGVLGVSDSPSGYGGSFQNGNASGTSLAALGNTGSQIFTVRANGNVGIGTSSPSYPLHIVKSDSTGTGLQVRTSNTATTTNSYAAFVSEANNGAVQAQMVSDGLGTGPIGTPGAHYGTYTNHPLGLITNNTERLRITNSGNVGIGITAPNHKLEISGGDSDLVYSSSGNAGVELRSSGTDNAVYLDFTDGSSSTAGSGTPDFDFRIIYTGETSNKLQIASDNANPIMTIANGGNIGIGTSSTANILTVVQNSSTDPIADAWTTYSSRRWKTNIQTLQGTLGKLERLRGVSFDWKETGKHDVGLIAEEVGEVVPEVVAYEENGVDAKSVDYARLVAVLIEAVKEQQAQIRQLQEEMEGLKARMGIEVSQAVTSDK